MQWPTKQCFTVIRIGHVLISTTTDKLKNVIIKDRQTKRLTVGVFKGLLLFGGLGDDFDPLAEEDTDVSAVAVEHLDRQHEVLSLVRVGYVQGFGCAIILEDTGRERRAEGRNQNTVLCVCHRCQQRNVVTVKCLEGRRVSHVSYLSL